MSDQDREAEDVAGLFRKFGGDAKGYKEFEPVPEPGQPQAAWPLIPGSRPGALAPVAAPASAPVAAVAPAPTAPTAVAPTPAIPAPIRPIPAPLPTAAAAMPATPASSTGSPRELDLLFARLSGQPQPAPEGGHGLMSRWRKPS